MSPIVRVIAIAAGVATVGSITTVCIMIVLCSSIPHDYINEIFGLKYDDRGYRTKSQEKFFELDLVSLYGLSADEHDVMEAFFWWVIDSAMILLKFIYLCIFKYCTSCNIVKWNFWYISLIFIIEKRQGVVVIN